MLAKLIPGKGRTVGKGEKKGTSPPSYSLFSPSMKIAHQSREIISVRKMLRNQGYIFYVFFCPTVADFKLLSTFLLYGRGGERRKREGEGEREREEEGRKEGKGFYVGKGGKEVRLRSLSRKKRKPPFKKDCTRETAKY